MRVLYFAGLEFTDEEWFALEESAEGVGRSSNPARHGRFYVNNSSVAFEFADGGKDQTVVFLFDVAGRKMNAVYTSGPVDVAYVHDDAISR